MATFVLASLSLFYLMSVATEAQQVPNKTTQGTQGKIAPEHTVMVPTGQTYVKLDQSKKAIGTFTAGQSMGVLNCAQIPCPSTFNPGTVCWQCKESASLQRQ
jgi:hypothetical protein